MIELILKCDVDGRMEMNIYRRKISHEKTRQLQLDFKTVM